MELKNYTYQQKIAILRVLTDIINADGRIDERETFLFEKLKKDFNLSEEDHKVALEKNSLLALVQIKNLNEEQKNNLATMMSQMIIVDEDINVNEVDIYNIVKDVCGIKEKFEDMIASDEHKKYSKS
jgi:uncharacterized tellurite resistance protein B-like protein